MKRILKWILILTIALFTIKGTFSNKRGGFVPFKNNCVGKNLGINIGGFTTELPEAKFSGISLSGLSVNNLIILFLIPPDKPKKLTNH